MGISKQNLCSYGMKIEAMKMYDREYNVSSHIKCNRSLLKYGLTIHIPYIFERIVLLDFIHRLPPVSDLLQGFMCG
jgi:hypothetical protein